MVGVDVRNQEINILQPADRITTSAKTSQPSEKNTDATHQSEIKLEPPFQCLSAPPDVKPSPGELQPDGVLRAQFTDIDEKERGNSVSPGASGHEHGTPTNRCHVCHKRVGLTGITCRCGFIFCGYHRYTDRHNCTYDYQVQGREDIRRQNPTISGTKLPKI